MKRKFGQEIKDTLDAATLGDIWWALIPVSERRIAMLTGHGRNYDVRDLQEKLGEQKGLWLFDACRGREYSKGERACRSNVK